MLLGHDASQTSGGENIFGLGGIALSPPLDARTTYDNFDTRRKKIQIDPSKGLTTHDFSNLPNLAWAGWYGYEGIVDNFFEDEKDFIDRLFNQLGYIDLKIMLSSINIDRRQIGEISYYYIFINTAFRDSLNQNYTNLIPNPMSSLSDSEINALYDLYSNPAPYLRSIDRPFLLYLSQDDPLAFPGDSLGKLPKIIADALEEASQNEKHNNFLPKVWISFGTFIGSHI